jgi:hypothetical protein
MQESKNFKTLFIFLFVFNSSFFAQRLDWVKSISGTGQINTMASTLDASGNVYAIGRFQGTVDFDPGSGIVNLTSNGGADVFIQKLTSSGNLVWAKSFGGTLNELGSFLAIDGSGNLYATGYFQGTVDFDPGSGTVNLTSNGGEDIFIQKLTSSGNLIWAKSFGGSSNDNVNSLSVDSSGNFYIMGIFSGTVDFDPGLGTVNLTSNGNSDVYVQKLTSSGNLVWAKSFGGTSHEFGRSISIDDTGNVYIAGSFSGTADFDPGSGIFNLTSNGGEDIFIQKLTSSGNLVWAKSFGGPNNELPNSISLDSWGNVYNTGFFSGTVDFDPGLGTVNLTSNRGADVYIQKLTSSGNLVWAKSFGGSSTVVANSIFADAFGNVYTTGYFSGTADFDLGSGIFNLTSNGLSDVFIQKLTSSGNLVWAKSFGGSSYDQANFTSVDASGNVITSGIFSGTVDFDPGIGTVNLTSNGGYDFFIQKLTSSGNLVWAKSYVNVAFVYPSFSASDGSGNVFTSGVFKGTVDFDPGPGTVNLTSNGGNYDVFIQKLTSSGNLVWAKSFGGASLNEVTSISVDASGNVYTTGRFAGTVDFDPGSGTVNLTSNGSYDVFIQKLTSSGNLVWAKSFGGPNYELPNSISLDRWGNVYNTGIFGGTVDFDPGLGTVNLTSNGGNDVYVQKLTSSGNLVWAKSFGGTFPDMGQSISLDASGNVYTTGYFQGTVDFDPGSGTVNLTSNGVSDVFIQKLTSSGNLVWAKSFGGSSSDMATSISVDASGNVYTTGSFAGTADFDPGSSIINLTSNGSADVFIQKLTSSGNLVWAKSFGGTNYDYMNSVSIDSSGNIYTLGDFQGTIDLDPDSGTVYLTSNGGRDVFIQKLTSFGNLVWAKSFGGSSSERGRSITLDDFGNIYTTGNFSGIVDFDPDSGILNLISNGTDVFIQKLTNCNFTTGTDIQTACDSYTWINGVTYTSSNNTARDTLTNAQGCDSIVTLNLTINNSTTGVDVQTACDSYTWINGVTYTSSNNTATDTLTNSQGCDSVVTLNLTINSSTTSTDVQTACDSFTWINGVTYTSSNNTARDTLTNAQGCDSIVTLNLTINNSNTGVDTQTACDSYTWINGVTYTSSNNKATDTLTNSQGCDSIVTLNLTINNSTTGVDVQTACDSYTWINGVTYTSSNNTATDTLTNSQGCDSIVTLNLTINNSTTGVDVQTACDSYTWINGVTYTSSNNTATETLTNSQGCDSIVTLNLIIYPSVAITSQPMNQTVFVGGNAQFQVTASGTGLTYQWQQNNGTGFMDISSFGIYSGTTTNTLTISGVNASIQQNGYRCKITNSSGCSDTTVTAILYISLTSIEENGVEESFKLFPNPTSSQLNIQTSIPYSSGIILNALGQTVMQFKNERTLDVSNLKAGNYILIVKGEHNEVLKTEKFNKY